MLRFFLLLIIGMNAACTADKLEPSADPEDCDSIQATYLKDVKEIVDQSCAYAGCHTVGFSSGDFTTYETMLPRLENNAIFQRTIEFQDMPPSSAPGSKKLSDSERNILECWLTNDFPKE